VFGKGDMNEIWELLVTTWTPYSMSSWDGYPRIQRPNLQPGVRSGGGVYLQTPIRFHGVREEYFTFTGPNITSTVHKTHVKVIIFPHRNLL